MLTAMGLPRRSFSRSLDSLVWDGHGSCRREGGCGLRCADRWVRGWGVGGKLEVRVRVKSG
jgi:hypothetical protein